MHTLNPINPLYPIYWDLFTSVISNVNLAYGKMSSFSQKYGKRMDLDLGYVSIQVDK